MTRATGSLGKSGRMKWKWLSLAAWMLIAVVATMFAGSVSDVESSDIRSWLPATAESTRALDVAEAHFSVDDPENLLIVYARDGLTEADRAAVETDAATLRSLPPIPSQDGKALLLMLPLSKAQVAEDAIAPVLQRVREVVRDGLPGGLAARITGGPAAEADFDSAFDSLDTTLLLVTVAVVAVLLLVTYRSPVLLLIPLASVGLASLLAGALVHWAAKHLGLIVDPQSAGILTVLVFGAGTDYAMLLISRYREELRHHEDRHLAMAKALRRSFPAIAASAVTVILALLTLLFADLNSTRGLGPVAAIGIASALLAMTTLLPALLVLCGRWAFWPLIPKVGSEERKGWSGIANMVARRPRPIWIATALLLAAASLGITTLSVGLKQSESFTTKPESVHGFELLAAHYAAGSSSPAEVYLRAETAPQAAAELAKVAGVDHVEEPELSGGWTKIKVVLADDPGGAKAEQTVVRLREAVHVIDPAGLVGGSTAQALDQDSTMDRDLRLVIPLILLVVLGVLMVLLRALVAPLLLLASVVLSFGAALGASAAVFHLLGFPTLDKSVLLNGFLFLVALGVDYTIFLMTRAREETALIGHRAGVPKALAVTGGVITSAGIVLAATFSVLAVMPVVFMLQLGVVVAVGVLLDTFVVRSLLVPALVVDVGPRVWWPTSRYP
ncbi:MAG TPA: hypothetical protein DGT23_03340 [Micromonosporaceae bacterium]|nr:hypothetical protein [Micromonosporaceae bacterium]